MDKLLNKLPCLDKGHVALFSLSMRQKDLLELKRTFTLGDVDSLLDIPKIHLHIKCPLFVQLTFGQFNLHTLVKKGRSIPEAFMPTVAEVQAKDLEASEAIADDIMRTTEALLLNPKAYQYEACDTFISQVISPISVYNTIVVSGTLKQWITYTQQKYMPAAISAYRDTILDIILAEYNQLEEWIKYDEKSTSKK